MSYSTKIGTYTGAILIGIPTSLTLEVLGAAGAIWGGSEVLTLRNDDNEESVRAVAYTVGAIAFISYCCRHSYARPDAITHHGFFSACRHAMASPWEALITEHSSGNYTMPS